jgi:atrial natriuretic peptide receptor A
VTVMPGTPASQKGDVYSFAIVLEEIVVRGGPYESVRQYMPVTTILGCLTLISVCQLKNNCPLFLDRVAAHENPPFRPFVGERDCPPDLLDLMERCWNDSAEGS